MNKYKIRPLDEEERELIESVEKGEWQSIPEKEKNKFIKEAKAYAEASMKKNKRMNIRISERDLRRLKIKALEENIPYQTLVSMVLHKYLSGKLKDNETAAQ